MYVKCGKQAHQNSKYIKKGSEICESQWNVGNKHTKILK